ncbi:MAG: type II secretion system GspH family protein [Verrucomicrobiota bacterium]|jgi:prepilin-type N-terminal cleavage/methylation domain-containing protein|nr:type II secretion system GspH family protein [Verrucomicrobiota bacterium]
MKRAKRSSPGFTLIELLVVVAIIGLLTAIVVPSINGGFKAAKKARAMREIKDLQGALQRYVAEYNRMPVPSASTAKHGGKDVLFGADNHEVVDILLNRKSVPAAEMAIINPRQLAFLDLDSQTLDAYDPDKTGGQSALMDPWGTPYEILMDMNFDDKIEVDNLEIRSKLAVRSHGADGKADTDDDLKTW